MACSAERAGLPTAAIDKPVEDSSCVADTRDFYVAHVSTVDFNRGETVNLFVRERSCGGQHPPVLLIQGRSVYAAPSFDLQFKDYSWMEYLAKAGFDVYAMDLQGYGGSTIPNIMDNPCNTSTENQTKYLIPNPLATTCAPADPKSFGNFTTDWDEIDAVVEQIRESRQNRTAKISLIGWSRGGLRAMGYAAVHPDKVDRLVALAPTRWLPSSTNPTFPLNVVNQTDYFADMNRQQKCSGQTESGVQDAHWSQHIAFDPLGATWGPSGGTGIKRSPSFALGAGWKADIPSKISVPTMVIRGELDDQAPAAATETLYSLIPAQKVYVTVTCGSHELPTETRHRVLYDASAQWLSTGSVDGCSNNCSLTK